MVTWLIYALLSAFLFALKDIIAKKFLKQNTSAKQIVFEEFFIMLLIVLILFFPTVQFESVKTLWHLYLIKAVVVAGSQFLYLKLLKTFAVSTVSPLLNLTTIFVLLFSSILLSEQITLIQLFGVFIMIACTYFLEVTVHHHRKTTPHKFHWSDLKDKDWKFHLTALVMLLFFASASVTDKLILQHVNVYTNLYFTSSIIFVFFTIYYLQQGHLLDVLKNIKKEPETLIIAILAMMSNFLILIAIAVPGALISLVVPVRRTSTLMSSLFGGILFHEKHLKKKLIITAFMLIGFVLIVAGDASFIEL